VRLTSYLTRNAGYKQTVSCTMFPFRPQKLPETFPDAMDNEGVIRGDNVKWFSLYIKLYY
jgi:hypothetical protein